MANPWAGEVTLDVDGTPQVCKLTLGALAELETRLQTGTLVDLVERFEQGKCSASDVLQVTLAGLRGGGWSGKEADLLRADIGGGVGQAARVAAQMLVRAFALPDEQE